MTRLRAAALSAVLVLTLGLGTAAMAGEEAPGRDAPAVTIGDPSPPAEDEAWTFRYLVPTLLAMSAVGIGLTAFAYARRVKGRYRVAR